jgi:ketosteroid isomerase-like protein
VSANLDLVRSIYADWERGDFSRTDWADPEIEFVAPEGFGAASSTGVAEMSGYREWLSAWDEVRYEATAIRELDRDRVLVLARFTGHGKMSGLELGQLGQVASMFHLGGGKVTRLIIYAKAENALADLGLGEKAMAEKSRTPDLVELVQRGIDAMNARDIDAVTNLLSSDVVWKGAMGTAHGRAELRGFFQDWLSAYDEFEYAAEEIRDLGNGVTLSVLIQRGRPRGSTGWIQVRYAPVTTWVDGLVRQNTDYFDVDEARAAAERLAEEKG